MTVGSFSTALKFWAKLGLISFGGPAGQIAIMRQELVDRKGWISEAQFLRALNFSMLLPGPEAQQLATYMGWRLHGTLGGLVAGALFVLPAVLIILVLSWLAAARLDVPAVAGAFYGIQPVVAAVVIVAVIRMGRKSLRHPALYVFPALALLAVRFGGISFPWVVLASGLGGVILHRFWPRTSCLNDWDETARACRTSLEEEGGRPAFPPWTHPLKVLGVCAGLWALPVGLLVLWQGWAGVLVQEALFFTKAAFVTFGGAYAVLSYIADFAVSQSWLSPQQMLIGLGLAESTPGPLIMVTQFVGFLGAWNLAPAQQGLFAVLGALVTTYVTFLPCFFFIFAGSPYIEALAGNPRLQAALGGVTAAVVGVILNLGIYFGEKVLLLPGGGVDLSTLGTALVSLALLLWSKVPLHFLILAGAVWGAAWRLFLS